MEPGQNNHTMGEEPIIDTTDTGFIMMMVIISFMGVVLCFILYVCLCMKGSCTDRGSGGRSQIEVDMLFQRVTNWN